MTGTLEAALHDHSPLQPYVQPGKRGMQRVDRRRVQEVATARVTDSLPLDERFAGSEPTSPRWDYWLGVRDGATGVIGVEVHPATAGEVDRVIRKKDWGTRKAADELQGGVRTWYWIASGKVGLSKTTREYRKLALHGIVFVGGRLRLK
jgi:hypothetical protein